MGFHIYRKVWQPHLDSALEQIENTESLKIVFRLLSHMWSVLFTAKANIDWHFLHFSSDPYYLHPNKPLIEYSYSRQMAVLVIMFGRLGS